eukprot:7385282-Prymnesium_polylepis.2
MSRSWATPDWAGAMLRCSSFVRSCRMVSLSEFLGKGSMVQLKELHLFNNQIGDAGMVAFAKAVANGAMPNLQVLVFTNNKIGDKGMVAFGRALGDGALKELKVLALNSNQIGDAGMMSIAKAIAKGALEGCATMTLSRNLSNDASVMRLRAMKQKAKSFSQTKSGTGRREVDLEHSRQRSKSAFVFLDRKKAEQAASHAQSTASSQAQPPGAAAGRRGSRPSFKAAAAMFPLQRLSRQLEKDKMPSLPS